MLDPQPESALQCPKVGCDWLCLLIFNLAENPREYTFDIRAQVAGVWNKWVPIARRYMSFPSVNSRLILYFYSQIFSENLLMKFSKIIFYFCVQQIF